MSRSVHWIALVCAVLVIGCGKAKDPKPDAGGPVTNNTPLQAPAPDVGVPSVPKPLDVPSPKPKSLPAGALPELQEGFAWNEVGGEEPQYQVSVPDPNETPQDLATITAPAPGANSTTFVVEAAGSGGAATSQAPKSDFTLPDGLTALPEFGYSEDGAPLRVKSDKDGATMAYVPSGTIRLGYRNGPPEVSTELAVPLDAFYIDVNETTLAQYEAYRVEMRDVKKQPKPPAMNADEPQNYPVRGLTWGESKSYANWAGKTLPTEAQWEMAARSEKGFIHPWGDGKTVWPVKRDPQELTAVASYRTDRSVFGVFDMAGNVREWVTDPWSPTALKDAQSTAVAQLRNWEGPKRGAVENMRVVKGNGPDWTLWHREGVIQTSKLGDVGFRGVVSLKSTEKGSSKDTKKK